MIIIADRLTGQLRADHDPASAPATIADQLHSARDNQTTVEAFVYDGAVPVSDAAGFSFEIGLRDYQPRGGFTLSYGASTTGAIDSTALTAGAIEAALNNLATIGTDGFCDVERYGSAGSYAWTVTLRSEGAASETWSSDTEDLAPHSSLIVTVLRTGDASTKAQWLMELAPDSLATATSWAAKASPTVAVAEEVTGDADTQEVQLITITGAFDPAEYMEVDADGTNKFTIAMGASAAEMETALNAELGAGSVDVTKDRAGQWRVEWQSNGAQTDISVALAGADAREGSTANLSFDNVQAALALAGRTQVAARAWLKLGNEVVYQEDLTLTQAAVIPGAGAPGAAIRRRLVISTTDPTTASDTSEGYDYFSLWVNTGDNGVFVLADPTTDAAVWTEIAGSPDQNLWLTVAGDSGITTASTSTDALTIAGGSGVITTVSGDTLTIGVSSAIAPGAITSSGTAGDIAYDSDYLYICVSSNSWKRTILATW